MSVLIALYAFVIVTAAAIVVDHWLATPADMRLRRRLWKNVWFGELALTLAYYRYHAEHQPCGQPGCPPAQPEMAPQGGTPERPVGETPCCSGSCSQ
ncbi:MAG TPA: hypothetical protein VFL82_01130 [Thermomicrobiales bacterium]|jgi:hypothetical protein|nr:hypothetical protein [Thermomicrobiales bacterium]